VASWLSDRERGVRASPPPGPVRVWLSGLGGARPLRTRYRKAFREGGADAKDEKKGDGEPPAPAK
jgi:hypothetical protein